MYQVDDQKMSGGRKIPETKVTGEEIKNLIKGIKPKRDDDLTSDSSDDSDNQKAKANKGPLPSFTKDQDFPLPN